VTSAGEPWRVVIIEDMPEDRAELRSLLLQGSTRRYTFIEAASSDDGVRAVRDAQAGLPDCVLLDYYLPDARGEETLDQLTGDDGVLLVPVVVITGGASSELGERALRAGAEDFVGKASMTAESLTRIVENAVRRWTMARELRASEARFRHLAAAVPQAVWMLDARGQLLYANDRWHAYFGARGVLSAAGDWSAVHHPEEADAFTRMAPGDGAYQRDCRLLGADGQFRWHQVNGVPIFARAGQLTHWYGVNTDIHHRKLAEQRLGVEHAVSRILAHAASFADAAPAILEAIARGLDMDVCALWVPDEDGACLRCLDCFDRDRERFRDFVAQTRTLACALGVGLPGSVWQSRQAEWLTTIAHSPRAAVAQAAGLASGAAYPIVAGDSFLGVIELFSTAALPADPLLLEMLSALGNELGQFILRKRAEHAVEDNASKLRLALEASHTGLWTWDLRADALDWTPECFEILGVAPHDFAGTGAAFFQLVHPDDRTRVEASVRAAIADQALYTCEFRVVRPDGETRWVQNRGRATYHPDGTALRMVGSLTDVDDRKQVTEALARSEERLARAQAAAHLGTWDWNVVTGEASWTDEAFRVFRGTPADLEPITYERFLGCVHPDDRAHAAAVIGEALATGRYRDEFRVRHVDGTIRWVEAVAETSYDASGSPVRLIGTARDVTAHRETDQALRTALDQAEHAVLARERLVSMVSHDLRSPLSALTLDLSLLQAIEERPDSAPADRRRSLDRMARQVATMTRMIDELLDVTILQAGKPLPLERRETDLVELARRLVTEYQRATRRHEIEMRAPADRVVGLWDPARIERAVDNLLSNAIKYSPHGGRVVVAVELSGPDRELVTLRVQDQGIGIQAADRARVFEWFGRGETAKQNKIGGIGIGLAGVKQIVEQHGGSISVDSEEGIGSTFTMRLPTGGPPPHDDLTHS